MIFPLLSLYFLLSLLSTQLAFQGLRMSLTSERYLPLTSVARTLPMQS